MPKEITHWTLAAALAKKLPDDSLFYQPIQSFFNLFLLGAVTPDIPFYYFAGPKTAFIQNLSALFHGSDARALVPVLAFLDQTPDREPAALAFAAGVICHILADTMFHPLVYYFAGMDGLHPGATARHRQFETAMDLHFWHLSDDWSRNSLTRVVRKIEVSKRRLIGLLGDLFQTRSERKYLGLALYFYMTSHYLFRSSMAHKTFLFLSRKTGWIPKELTGLIYPFDGPVNLSFFNQRFRYQDTCTGTLFSTKIQEIVEENTLAGKGLLSLISTNLVQGKPAMGVLYNPDLPKIRPGLDQDRFFFWRERDDFETDLYGGLDPNYLL